MFYVARLGKRTNKKNWLFVDRWPNKRKSLPISFASISNLKLAVRCYPLAHSHIASDQTHQFHWCLRVIEARRQPNKKIRTKENDVSAVRTHTKSILAAPSTEHRAHAECWSLQVPRHIDNRMKVRFFCHSPPPPFSSWLWLSVRDVVWRITTSKSDGSVNSFFPYFSDFGDGGGEAVARKLVNSTSQLMPFDVRANMRGCCNLSLSSFG